jgi:hypothetical protein
MQYFNANKKLLLTLYAVVADMIVCRIFFVVVVAVLFFFTSYKTRRNEINCPFAI